MNDTHKAIFYSTMLINQGHRDVGLERAGYEMRRLYQENLDLREALALAQLAAKLDGFKETT
jgi:hypothetical protein